MPLVGMGVFNEVFANACINHATRGFSAGRGGRRVGVGLEAGRMGGRFFGLVGAVVKRKYFGITFIEFYRLLAMVDILSAGYGRISFSWDQSSRHSLQNN